MLVIITESKEHRGHHSYLYSQRNGKAHVFSCEELPAGYRFCQDYIDSPLLHLLVKKPDPHKDSDQDTEQRDGA